MSVFGGKEVGRVVIGVLNFRMRSARARHGESWFCVGFRGVRFSINKTSWRSRWRLRLSLTSGLIIIGGRKQPGIWRKEGHGPEEQPDRWGRK